MRATRAFPAGPLAILLASAIGCGVDELGVLRVDFELDPAPTASRAEGIDTSGAAAWSGALRVDAVDGAGVVDADGLPQPEGRSYRVTAAFAHGERDALPGAADSESTGHTHGALRAGVRRRGTNLGDLTDVVLGDLAWDGTNGVWVLRFFADDTDGHPLGALRACTVDLAGGPAEAVTLLAGAVGQGDE
jgi:hypothetical protein